VHHAVQLTQRVDDLVYIADLLEHERGAQFVCGGSSRRYVERLRVGTYES
jgi:HD superfamily phosphohydrolase YqeK